MTECSGSTRREYGAGDEGVPALDDQDADQVCVLDEGRISSRLAPTTNFRSRENREFREMVKMQRL